MLAGRALGMNLTLEQLDPIGAVIESDPEAVSVYRAMRPMVDYVAEAVLSATESLPSTESLPPTEPPRAF